jgi:hypothetical protein
MYVVVVDCVRNIDVDCGDIVLERSPGGYFGWNHGSLMQIRFFDFVVVGSLFVCYCG